MTLLCTCRIQKQNIFWADRGEAAHGGAAGRDGADQSIPPRINRFRCRPENRRQPFWTSLRKHEQAKSNSNRWRNTCRAPNSDISRAGRDGPAHGETAGRGGAGTGRTGRRRVGPPRKQLSPLPSRRSKKTLQGVSLEARTKETLYKPMEEQNPRLTTD